jgi:hypothetical protein
MLRRLIQNLNLSLSQSRRMNPASHPGLQTQMNLMLRRLSSQSLKRQSLNQSQMSLNRSFRPMNRLSRSPVWFLRSPVWFLRSPVWFLRCPVWFLRCPVWFLRRLHRLSHLCRHRFHRRLSLLSQTRYLSHRQSHR